LLKAALPGELSDDLTLGGSAESASSSATEAGTHLKYFGDYELLEEIARGGMGVVWRARQTSLKRDVAVKMIRAGTLAGKEEVERFLREAEAAANLQHPNIVAIHEVGEHEGRHYFSMDYVAGRDLATIVKDGPLAPYVAARYVKIIAEAINFAHQRGVLHRDLKPQNVLIDQADQPRITDFGLAKLMKEESRLTQSGMLMGSPSYMSPEQAAGPHGDVGPASDVYSIGALLYELITGRPPFCGATALDTVIQVVDREPTPPRRLKGDVPLDLETICLKCLEKSRSARYPTARALAEDLERFLKGEPILARPASTVRKLVSWARRHPGIMAGLAAFISVVLGFCVLYLFDENAFLRARQANPDLERVRGARSDVLKAWSAFNSLVGVAGLFMYCVTLARARGVWVKDMLNPALLAKPMRQPLDERTRHWAVALGLLTAVSGVLLLVLTIHAYVWEGQSIWSQIGMIYFSAYFGLATLGMVVRDNRLRQFTAAATPSRQLTDAQVEPIRIALESFNFPGAVKAYRNAVPDADLVDAQQYVIRMYDRLKAQNPAKFVPPPLSLANLNWRAIGVCAAIQAIVLVVALVAVWPMLSYWDAAQFAYMLLLGIGCMAMLRLPGTWRKLLALVPGLLLGIVTELVFPQWIGSPTRSVWPYFVGFFCGQFLMMLGYTPRRRA
jgi:predicted Ser/Thr protein kinase